MAMGISASICRLSSLSVAVIALVISVQGAEGPTGRVPEGFRAAPGTAAETYTNTGWAKEIVHEATGIAMVYIPAGSFTMGGPGDAAGRDDYERHHRVTLTRGFYLGKYEVTQGQWERVMGGNPSNFKRAGAEAPVEQVLWDDCQAFCRKLGKGFRLPTEAEWEYAARGGPVSQGFVYAGSDYLDRVAWYGVPFGGTTHPVGQKRANELGLCDMSGNVWEWCEDWHGKYPAGAVTDPAGPVEGLERVYRGGSWETEASDCSVAARGVIPPSVMLVSIGLRLTFCSNP